MNTTSRLEGFDKPYDADDSCRILVGDATRQHLGDRYEVKPVGSVALKGEQRNVELFQVLGVLPAAGTDFEQSNEGRIMSKLKPIFLAAAVFMLSTATTPSVQAAGSVLKENAAPTQAPKKTAAEVPVYYPPFRGAPSRSVSGGTRGPASDLLVLAALAPEHIGLTTREQPVLYWYLSKSAAIRLEFTLNQEGVFEPLLEMSLDAPAAAGIQALSLADHGIRLEPGKTYQWFVALIPDPEHRSQDILASGAIQRIIPSADLSQKLAGTDASRHVFTYAEAGIWYDAVEAISQLIAADPDNGSLRQQRAALTEQVNLPEVAGFDRQGKL